MNAHTARVKHLTTGWLRWLAVCGCGWSRLGFGRDDAQRLADEHTQAATR